MPCLSSPVSFFLCGFLPAVLFSLCGGTSAPSPAHQSTLPPPLIRYAHRQHISQQIIRLNSWFKYLHVLNKLLVLVSETKWTIDGYFNTKWSCKQRVSVSQFSSKVDGVSSQRLQHSLCLIRGWEIWAKYQNATFSSQSESFKSYSPVFAPSTSLES